MSRQSATVECPTYPSLLACPIRVRYAEIPGALAQADFAAGGCDCHLIHVQPAQDGASMEIHFTGCPGMLADLSRVLEIHDVEEEDLLCSFAGEYRQVGLCVGAIDGYLDADSLLARLRQAGRPVELVGESPFFSRRKAQPQIMARDARIPA